MIIVKNYNKTKNIIAKQRVPNKRHLILFLQLTGTHVSKLSLDEDIVKPTLLPIDLPESIINNVIL